MSSPELRKCPEPERSGSHSFDDRGNGAGRFEPADVLSQRFNSLERLGTSGDATLYRDRDRDKDGLNIVRVFSEFTGDYGALELFVLESKAAARLSHCNIVKAGLPEEFEGVHFSVIEHPTGAETLKTLLDRVGWVDVDLALDIAYRVACALEHAHSMGVLHLRIEPGNILIEQSGSVLVNDFGIGAGSELAWAHQERSRHFQAHYLSPEQANGSALDHRSDLYSLGVVLYKMLTDRVPFDSEDPDQLRERLITHAAMPPHFYRAELSESLSAAVSRLLEKNPEKRFQDAASFRQALENCFEPSADIVSEPELGPDPRDVNNLDDSVEPEQAGFEQDPPREEEVPSSSEEHASFSSEGVSTVSKREPFESPTITVLNGPGDQAEVGVPAGEVDTQQSEGEVWNGESSGAAPRLHSISAGPAARAAWRPMLLILVLALAFISAAVLISHTDRAGDPNWIENEEPAAPDSDTGVMTPVSDSSTQETADEPADAQPSLPTSSAVVPAALKSPKPAAASKLRRGRKAGSWRLRRARKKWRRPPELYRNNSRYPERVH